MWGGDVANPGCGGDPPTFEGMLRNLRDHAKRED